MWHGMTSWLARLRTQPLSRTIADAYDVTNILFSSGTTGEPCSTSNSLLMTWAPLLFADLCLR